jgi:hypothetical protein
MIDDDICGIGSGIGGIRDNFGCDIGGNCDNTGGDIDCDVLLILSTNTGLICLLIIENPAWGEHQRALHILYFTLF